MSRRVVITGTGLITPLGLSVSESWPLLCAGRSGIGPIESFDPSGFKTRIAGEVKGFRPEAFLGRKEARRTHRFVAFAIGATKMALEDAGLAVDGTNGDRVGVLTGCGMGGLDLVEKAAAIVKQKGPGRVSPFFIPMMIGSMASGMISIHFKARGPVSSVSSACAAGTHAVGEAFRIIQRGDADVMITGGVESVITPTCMAGFNAMRALSMRNSEPSGASRPFDRDRDGFVVGEGAGILILESLESAARRGAEVIAEIAGFGMSGDACHITTPTPDGRGAAVCMKNALDDAGLTPSAVDYINAHGTGTGHGDISETRAIKRVFKDHARRLSISSTKSMTGHLLGGAGGVEAVFSALTIRDGIIPPTINLENPDEECDLDFVPLTARRQDVSVVMTNSFGFGGINATLVLKKFTDQRAFGGGSKRNAVSRKQQGRQGKNMEKRNTPIIMGCDHAAFPLKEKVKAHLVARGFEVKDVGTYGEESVDYTDFGLEVAGRVSEGEYERGVLLCGTGLGMSMVANRFPHVRAALCSDVFSTKMSRLHNDSNILVLGGRVIGDALAMVLVDTWLATSFEGGRHQERLDRFDVISR